MGIRLNITGADTINLGKANITSYKFIADNPNDSNARSADAINTIVVKGKILTALDGNPADDTMKIAKWSAVEAEDADSYRSVTVELIAASKIVRKVNLPNAFILSYAEDFSDSEGVGTFELVVRQRKDKLNSVTVEGGYEVTP